MLLCHGEHRLPIDRHDFGARIALRSPDPEDAVAGGDIEYFGGPSSDDSFVDGANVLISRGSRREAAPALHAEGRGPCSQVGTIL